MRGSLVRGKRKFENGTNVEGNAHARICISQRCHCAHERMYAVIQHTFPMCPTLAWGCPPGKRAKRTSRGLGPNYFPKDNGRNCFGLN